MGIGDFMEHTDSSHHGKYVFFQVEIMINLKGFLLIFWVN